MFYWASKVTWNWQISVLPANWLTQRVNATPLSAHPSGWRPKSSNNQPTIQRYLHSPFLFLFFMFRCCWCFFSSFFLHPHLNGGDRERKKINKQTNKQINKQMDDDFVYLPLSHAGGHMVVGHHGHRIGQRGTAQLRLASNARPFPHPQEQSTAIDGQLFQTV